MDDETLVAALRAAGHEGAADAVRDKALAGQLRAAGHEALADALANGTTPAAAPEPVSSQPTQQQHDAEVVLDALKRDTNIDLRAPEDN